MAMKKIMTGAVLLVCAAMPAQKMITRTGEVRFEASMPALEEVAATNNTASCIFDKATGEVGALVLMKGFRFKVPLMEEHFNENYVESDKYPKATFKGTVTAFDPAKLSASKVPMEVNGDLTLHGVTKKVKLKLLFAQDGGKLLVAGSFLIHPEDYNIEIPSVVRSKIANDITVKLDFKLDPK